MSNSFQQRKFYARRQVGIPDRRWLYPDCHCLRTFSQIGRRSSYVSALMSFLIYAGASQFIGVNLIILGASWWEIVITTFILNLRSFLMTATIAQMLEDKASTKWRFLLAFGITDETFFRDLFPNEKILSRYYSFGLNTVAFASWNFGTWIGLFFADGFPDLLSSMGIALYAMCLSAC